MKYASSACGLPEVPNPAPQRHPHGLPRLAPPAGRKRRRGGSESSEPERVFKVHGLTGARSSNATCGCGRA
eukprot:12351889-Alexandrium_andersonii.AAC.1